MQKTFSYTLHIVQTQQVRFSSLAPRVSPLRGAVVIQPPPLTWLSCAALAARLKETDVWGQCEVLRVLERYQPHSDDELFDILSLLDPLLVSPHPLVTAATARLFLSLGRRLPTVCHAALERVRAPLLAACGSVSREMRFAALCHIQVSR